MEAAVAVGVLHELVALFVILSASAHIAVRALGKIVLIHKIVAGVVGRVYVPAVLDTKKKPFSGTETPNKGIKQGLSRSIADFGSTCSLGWIADLRLMDREAITLAV